jgi:hypothetical protein
VGPMCPRAANWIGLVCIILCTLHGVRNWLHRFF